MLSVTLPRLRKVLCLGAHSDDIEIGCGGSLLKMARERPDLDVEWIVFSAGGRRTLEAQRSARDCLRGLARKKVVVKRFRASFFPSQYERLKKYFEYLKRTFQPELIFTHYRDDRHQDHRVLSELAWNTFRNHLILEYEVPKYDGDLGIPNFFVPLDDDLAQEKVGNLCRHFQTQGNKHWFTPDTFLGLMRLRGIECASPTRFAEAFHCRKLVL
jgi:LmbE family N-acetylglucosaminyl deacetylase